MSQERVAELEAKIRRASEAYYNNEPRMYYNKDGELVEGAPMSDADFDEMVDELTELFPESPALEEVGALPTWGRKVKHSTLMGSLAKQTESEKVLDWFSKLPSPGGKKTLLASFKMDGLAVTVRYDKGELVGAATRGDGEVGQDVLDNAKMIESIPKSVGGEWTGEVRGEVYMKKSVFRQVNEELAMDGKKQMSNPRNGAAGALLQKDAAETGKKRLDFCAYGVLGEDLKTERESQTFAEGMGFEHVEWEVVDPQFLDDYLEGCKEKRSKLDFQIDGIVFAVDSFEQQEEAGWNGKRPKGKIAWKFPAEQKETPVLGFSFQVGRTGKLTPVVHVEPTHIDGTTVSKISLASANRFEELALGRGERVLIEKAGDIIPQVLKVTWRPLKGAKFQLPEECPCCESSLVRNGAHLFCVNPGCESQLRRRILHWLTRMDVKGAGPSIVASMCESGLVRDISDLYYMKQEDLAEAIGSEKIAKNVIREIMTKSEMPLWRFVSSVGIPYLGRTAAKTITKKFKTLEELMATTESDLATLDGIDTTATHIVNGLKMMADEIKEIEKVIEIEEPVVGGVLSGMSFCLTGKMSRDRKSIAADIEAAGGEVKSSVGKGLGFLVMADANSTSSKAQKARKLGTICIDEEELERMINAS